MLTDAINDGNISTCEVEEGGGGGREAQLPPAAWYLCSAVLQY